MTTVARMWMWALSLKKKQQAPPLGQEEELKKVTVAASLLS